MALIEIVVSSLLLVIVAVGVFSAFETGTRSTSEERHRARAHSLAEQDLERMRSMRISDLANLNQTRAVTQDGTPYTIVSRSEYAIERGTTSTCSTGTGSRDYLKISSTVTWPSIGTRPPVVSSSLVTPPSGSTIPNAGSLLVTITDRNNAGTPGIGVSGTGPAAFNGTTGPSGCVIFRNLPEGNYTMSISGPSNYVDDDGNPPAPQVVSVTADATNSITQQYDVGGQIASAFQTRNYSNALVTTAATTAFTVSHPQMDVAKTFTGSPTPKTFFPFPSPSTYSAYASDCVSHDPGGSGEANVVVPQNGSVTATMILPALHVTVWTGTSSSPGSRRSNARVTIQDDFCGGTLREYVTNTSGQIADPGLPWSTYDVCAQYPITSPVDTRRLDNVSVRNTSSGTVLNAYLGSTTGSNCP